MTNSLVFFILFQNDYFDIASKYHSNEKKILFSEFNWQTFQRLEKNLISNKISCAHSLRLSSNLDHYQTWELTFTPPICLDHENFR